jgi:hypothetical protein
VVAALGQLRIPYEVLARKLGCHVDTVRERLREGGPQFDPAFSEAYHTGIAERNIALRQKQYAVAMAGSERMLIHLGKHELDQGDKVTLANDPESPIGIASDQRLDILTESFRERVQGPDKDD